MKKKLTLVVSLLLVMALSIGGTLAYLTYTTDAITNTFTIGNVTITLTETFNTDKNDDGTKDAWTGKIVPGGKAVKDPTITVKATSEKCYVYALIENNLVIGTTTVGTPNINTANWIKVDTKDSKTLYRYKEIVDAASGDQPLPVFSEVAYDGTVITEKNISDLDNKTIVVTAFAHQSDNVDQSVADDAAKALLNK